MCGLAQGAAEVRQAHAFFKGIELRRAFTHHKEHDGDGSGFRVAVGDGERDTLASFAGAQNNKIAGFGVLGHVRGINHQQGGLTGNKHFLLQNPIAHGHLPVLRMAEL